jgi:hypothetical protein
LSALGAALLKSLIETLLQGKPFPRKAGVSQDQQTISKSGSVGRQTEDQGDDVCEDCQESEEALENDG